MLFEGNINVAGMDVLKPEPDEEGNIAEGAIMALELTLATNIPMPTERGMVLVPIPVGKVRAQMPPEAAEKLAKDLAEVAATIPHDDAPATSDSLLVADQAMASQVIAQSKAVEGMKKGK